MSTSYLEAKPGEFPDDERLEWVHTENGMEASTPLGVYKIEHIDGMYLLSGFGDVMSLAGQPEQCHAHANDDYRKRRLTIAPSSDNPSHTAPSIIQWRPIEYGPPHEKLLLIATDPEPTMFIGEYRIGYFGEPEPLMTAWRCEISGLIMSPILWAPRPPIPMNLIRRVKSGNVSSGIRQEQIVQNQVSGSSLNATLKILSYMRLTEDQCLKVLGGINRQTLNEWRSGDAQAIPPAARIRFAYIISIYVKMVQFIDHPDLELQWRKRHENTFGKMSPVQIILTGDMHLIEHLAMTLNEI